jgi:transcriptional regulator with XRE-family HTH domain
MHPGASAPTVLTLGEQLRRYRDWQPAGKLRNCTLAQQLGVSRSTLSRLLADQIQTLDLHTARRLATVLALPLEVIAEAHTAGLACRPGREE